jgi:hypothetical protein
MRSRLASAFVSGLAALALAPGAAVASSTQESTFQDDNQLVYAEPQAVGRTMDELKALGVDRLRISVFWAVVAPAPKEQTKPAGFDGADPAAYPAGAWDRYDTIVEYARARGLGVNFNVTSPAPAWATGSLPGRPDLDKNFDPSAAEFGAFVRAVGTRYSGTYDPPVTPAAAPAPAPAPGPAGGLLPRHAGHGAIPRVDYWTVWNEPNQPGWLTPQWADDPRAGKGLVETAPRIYRALVDEMHAALAATGHGGDTFLIGETAPKGQEREVGPTRAIKPGRFIRQLYCLDDDLQVLKGTSAEVRGCPVGDQAGRFAADHPGLFKASGYAHHPYELTFAPDVAPKADNYTTGNLGALSALLRRIHQRYGQKIPGGGRDVPLHLTEYGYQTDPPDPAGVSFAKQAAYLNQAEWLTARNPRVRTLTQFLLVDDKPTPGVANPIEAFGGTFQSGLRTQSGKAKPALAAYALPIHLPARTVKRKRSLRVWGLVRAADNGTAPRVAVQQRGTAKGARFKTVKTVTASKARGYLSTTFKPLRSGAVRLVWVVNNHPITSRAVTFRVR